MMPSICDTPLRHHSEFIPVRRVHRGLYRSLIVHRPWIYNIDMGLQIRIASCPCNMVKGTSALLIHQVWKEGNWGSGKLMAAYGLIQSLVKSANIFWERSRCRRTILAPFSNGFSDLIGISALHVYAMFGFVDDSSCCFGIVDILFFAIVNIPCVRSN